MNYTSDSGQKLLIHDHASDQKCHWTLVLKSLAFLVFRSPFLIHSLLASPHGKGIKLSIMEDEAGYLRWLCCEGDEGLPNLLHVLLHVCNFRGMPNSPLL